jgi:hypothetical protein
MRRNALTIGFYTLALVIAAAVLAVAILPWVLRGSNNIWVTLTGAFLGVSILFAIFPRRRRFEPHGVRVMRITVAIKRRQEFAADQIAVDRAGRDTYVEGLRPGLRRVLGARGGGRSERRPAAAGGGGIRDLPA